METLLPLLHSRFLPQADLLGMPLLSAMGNAQGCCGAGGRPKWTVNCNHHDKLIVVRTGNSKGFGVVSSTSRQLILSVHAQRSWWVSHFGQESCKQHLFSDIFKQIRAQSRAKLKHWCYCCRWLL